jgi:hypothetical protein
MDHVGACTLHRFLVLSWFKRSKQSTLQLTRSICQGCPLAPFMYLFVADCLGYILEQNNIVTGLKLPAEGGEVIDQEYADDTMLY